MIGAAVIGMGYWGPNLARNFATADGCALVMCCDKDRRRLEKTARQYPAATMTDSFAEVLDNKKVDIVSIATPVHTHYRLAKEALSAGKHVLVEKPLTGNVAEAEELVDLAKKNGRVLMVDHTFIYHPAVEKIKDIIRRGELGDICYYDSVRINLGLFQHDISVLWDLAPHDASIMEHLIGKPVKWVQAAGARHAGSRSSRWPTSPCSSTTTSSATCTSTGSARSRCGRSLSAAASVCWSTTTTSSPRR